jgi:hypothetical protein
MIRGKTATFLLISILAANGCVEKDCEAILKPSFLVTAIDSVTSAPVIDGLAGFVAEGSFRADAYRLNNGLFFSISPYRPGTYVVSVRATGYREWRASNVRLRMDAAGCHVETVSLVAKLQR